MSSFARVVLLLLLHVEISCVWAYYSPVGVDWMQEIMTDDPTVGLQASATKTMPPGQATVPSGVFVLIFSFGFWLIALNQAVGQCRNDTAVCLSHCSKISRASKWIAIIAFPIGLAILLMSVEISCTYVSALRAFHAHDGGHAVCDDGAGGDVDDLTVRPSQLAHMGTSSVLGGPLQGGVPKIIHQTWRSRHMSNRHLEWVKSWNIYNPGWLHVLWTDDEIEQFMADEHPDAVPLFKSYPQKIMRFDLARAYILYSYGGVYADLDYEALSSLEASLPGQGLCLVDSPYKQLEDVQNSLMVSKPQHAFWPILFELFKDRASQIHQMNFEILDVTGPGVLSEALRRYEAQHGDKISRLDHDRFMLGNATQGGRAVAKHWMDDTWLGDVERYQMRLLAVCTLKISFVWMAINLVLGWWPRSADVKYAKRVRFDAPWSYGTAN